MYQWCSGEPRAIAVPMTSAASVDVPAASSHFVESSCLRLPSPISSGATMMMPSASEANQFSQVVRSGAPEL